ncbi:MAG: HAD family phosphatase [Gammaproteobacteria bacterium]|nr:HAD family phosphatase [Gammaproteobacteria bacterium]
MKRLVFFDLDGTLLNGISSENAFIIYLIKKRFIGIYQILAVISFILRWFPKFGRFVFIKNKAYLSGLSIEKVSALAQEFVKNNLIKKIRPNIEELVQMHLQVGDQIVLLTGSLEFLAKNLANYLKIDQVFGTICSEQDGKFTDFPPIQHPFSEGKLDIAKKICENDGIKLENCVAYGNSVNDSLILNAVGKPIAVTPDWRLKRIAKQKGWEIISATPQKNRH